MIAETPVLSTPRLTLRVAGPQSTQPCVNFNRENATFLAPWEPLIGSNSLDEDTVRTLREHAVADALAGRAYSFAIYMGDGRDDLPIAGWLNFTHITRSVLQACVMGYKLDRRMQGQGYMAEAAQAGIDFVFGTLRLHRIAANYMPHNQRSAALLRRLGFKVEGSAKAYLYIGGEWRDHVLSSLINPDPVVPPGL